MELHGQTFKSESSPIWGEIFHPYISAILHQNKSIARIKYLTGWNKAVASVECWWNSDEPLPNNRNPRTAAGSINKLRCCAIHPRPARFSASSDKSGSFGAVAILLFPISSQK